MIAEIPTNFHQDLSKIYEKNSKITKFANFKFCRKMRKRLTNFFWNIEVSAVQKHVNLVDLVKSFPTNIFLQNLASIQKRTSPIKFAHLAEKSANGSISNLSTKVLSTTGTFHVNRVEEALKEPVKTTPLSSSSVRRWSRSRSSWARTSSSPGTGAAGARRRWRCCA